MGNDYSNPHLEPRSIKKYGGFSNAELKDLRKNFQQISNSNGNLDRKKLSKFIKGTSPELDAITDYLDVDGNKEVDEYEFICGLSVIRQGTLMEKAKIIFSLYCQGKKKMMDSATLNKCIKTLLNTLQNLMQKPELEEAELKSIGDQYVTTYDADKNGEISELEFVALILKEHKVHELLERLGLLTVEDHQESTANEEEIDGDLTEELNLKHAPEDERAERIKSGIEHNVSAEDELFTEDKAGAGDQFMAVKPWVGAVKNSVPTDYKPSKSESDPPKSQLSLEFVHGYRCHDVRNNLKYAPNGDIVYHTAGVGIVFESKSRTQKFFMDHNDDIMCLDLYENYVITGQIGHKPLICLWDLATMSSIIMLKGELEKGIVNICFSNDGKRFAASSLDEEHNIVVYDIAQELATKENPKKTGLLAKGKGAKADILDMRFLPDNKSLVIACNKEVYFMEIDEGKCIIKAKKGLFGKYPPEPVMSIGFLGNNTVTGLAKGALLVWSGNSVTTSVDKAHEGAINAIYSVKPFERLITGGNDGNINIWDNKLKKLQSFTIKENNIINSMNPKVRAVCEKDGKILVGTRGSEIIEFINKAPVVHIRGHFDGELWGLTTHPNQACYYTVGEDMMLACWDIVSRALMNCIKLQFAAKTIHISPDGKQLAVGCLNGTTLIIDCSGKKLAVVNSLKEKHEVSIVKFSPNGEILAAGIAPPTDEVVIYNIRKNFAIQARLKGSPSRIIHVDFSENSNVIQFNNTSYEILFYGSGDGKQLTHGASDNKNEKWASWTLIIGWPVQGIWPPCSDGSDVNSVDRAKGGKVLATGDDFGKVKLFKYPCAKEKANCTKYGGHSAHVTAVRFTANDDYLITTGGGEKSIFQWKYDGGEHHDNEEDMGQNEEKESPKNKASVAIDDEFGEEEQGEGDQMGAVKPYLGQLMHSIPSWYKPSKKDKLGPDGTLALNYVHGFRCFDDCRNTAKWLADGRVAFVGAALGVVFDYKKNKQEFFNKHEEDLVSMAVHPKKKIVATGQMAAKGKAKTIDLYVWDSESKQDFCNLNHFHLRAIVALAFSSDGSKLLSVGQDDDNSLAIHDWSSKTLLCTSNVDKAKVTGAAWSPVAPNDFVTVGAKIIKFWTLNGRSVSSKIGKMDANDKLIPFTCVTYAFKGIVVTGSGSGDIALWNGGSAGKKIKAHQGEVGSLMSVGDVLYSGGGDGKVILWENKGGLTQKAVVLEVSTLTKYNPGVRSIDINDKGEYLIGTRGSELYVGDKTGKNWNCILYGHYDGEVWGCATSPNSYKAASCGGDKTIRLWDIDKNTMICGTLPLENDLRALDWDPKGEFIVAADMKGKIMLFNPEKLDMIHTLQSIFKPNPQKPAPPWIEDIKISPNSDIVAFGAHGGNKEIQMMSCKQGKLGTFKIINAALSSALTHLDFSVDGSMLVVNTQDYWLKFYSVDAAKDASASSAKDVKWFTWTCTLGFYAQGIFPGVDGTDVNSVCRSVNQKFLATGDDFGKVNLFAFPCVVPKAVSIGYIGHSSHVTKVKFSYDDTFLVSTGGNDKCVITWRTSFGKGNKANENDKKEEAKDGNNQDEEIGDENSEDVVKVKKEKKTGAKKYVKEETKKEDALFSEEAEEKGDEFMAVKPWLGAIKEPSGYKNPKDQNKPPNVSLELNYVFGYRAKDCRNNIRFLKSGSIVYHAAALGIVLDPENNTQRFFNKHIDDITAFDLHPDDETVATGEIGPKPSIYVWNSTTMEVKCQFKAAITKGIAALAFSPSGKRLVAAAIDDDHWVACMDVTGAGSVLAKVKGGRDVIISLAFNTEEEFASVGNKHYKYWKVGANTITGTKGDAELKITLNCSEFIDGSCIVGCSDGNVYNCKGSSMGKSYKIHEKSIDALCVTKENVFTGGKDNMIKVSSRTFQVKLSIDCNKTLDSSVCPSIRGLSLSSNNKKLLIGTYGSEIYQLTCSGVYSEKTTFSPAECFMTGHYTPNKQWTNEVWGLAPFHKGDSYLTSSDDGTLRVFSALERKQIKWVRTTLDPSKSETPLDKQTGDLQDSVKGRSMDIDQDDKMIAVGFKDGFVKIYDADTLTQIKSFKHAKEWISEVKFCPDNTRLAVGSHDNAIYVYSVPEFKKLFVMNKHSSYITHLDWSENSMNLHSNCGAYELLFWDAQSGKQLPGGASALRDENWATWTCVLGFPVQGIWPVCADGTDINYVDRSKGKHPSGYHLLASGDDFGKVRILKYPCILKNSEAVYGSGHSSHVPCVKWSDNDEFLYSVGGEDNCVFQWIVKKK